MKRHFLIPPTLILTVSFLLSPAIAFAFELPKWFPFSSERSLDEWETKICKCRVRFEVEKEKSGASLHALSFSSASAIFYRIKERYRVQDYPLLSWKWKVVRFPDKEKLKIRKGIERDDYAARVYVIFPSLNFLSSKVLEYVWDELLPLEAIFNSPYSANIKLIVIQTSAKELGKWVTEERNVLADYRRAFGKEPMLKVGAVALMSDADNTADIAEAYFDDIKIGYKKER